MLLSRCTRLALVVLVLGAAACSDPPAPTCVDWTSSSPASAELRAQGYQGGGPSYAAVLSARLEEESPELLAVLELDDEADALRICSTDPAAIFAARNAIGRMERDPALLRASIARAVASGEME